MEQPSKVLIALCSCRVTCSITRTEGAVALRWSGRQHGAEDQVGRACKKKDCWTAVHFHFHLETNVNAIFWDYNFITRCIVPLLKCNLCTLCCKVNLPDNSWWWTLFFKRKVNVIWIDYILKIYTQSMLLLLSRRDSAFLLLAACCVIKISLFFLHNFVRSFSWLMDTLFGLLNVGIVRKV